MNCIFQRLKDKLNSVISIIQNVAKKPKTVSTRTTSLQRTYNLAPRPRSPWQFQVMIKIALGLDGKQWNLKNSDGDLQTQIEFVKALSADPNFSLTEGQEDEMRGRTYLTMNPTRLGFCYKEKVKTKGAKKDILRFTHVSKQLADANNIEYLWLKQLLKWQIPSYQDNEKHMLKNSCHPFLSAIKICLKLGELTYDNDQEYLSKEEVGIFLITMTNDNQADGIAHEIIKLRNILAGKKKREKARLRNEYHINRLKTITYKADIEAGYYQKRQSGGTTQTPDEFAYNKAKQHIDDFSDTGIRYMRATGMFAVSDRVRRLKLNQRQRWKAEQIANDTNLTKLNCDYTNVEKFYEWFGDPSNPKLPWESIPGYTQEIFENLKYVRENL